MKSPSGVSKKIIYLDQCLLSRMVKMLDPDFPLERKNQPGFDLSFVRDACGKLHRLVKLQLIVCPESPFHHDESSLLDDQKPAAFRQHKRIWELLAGDTSFRGDNEIRNEQLLLHAKQIAGGGNANGLEKVRAINGEVDSWPSMRVSISLNWKPDLATITSNRNQTGHYRAKLAALYDGWIRDKPSFGQVFEAECKALGQCIIHLWAKALVYRRQMLVGDVDAAHEFFQLSMSNDLSLYADLKKLFAAKEAGDATRDYALNFLLSDEVKASHFVRLSCLLYAEISQRLIHGEGRKGLEMPFFDVDSIAAYLPYCDAMFVDRKMHDLLRPSRVADARRNMGKVFSGANHNEFLEYLDSILTSAPAHHLEMVRQRFGSKWEEPYFEVLEHDKRRSSN